MFHITSFFENVMTDILRNCSMFLSKSFKKQSHRSFLDTNCFDFVHHLVAQISQSHWSMDENHCKWKHISQLKNDNDKILLYTLKIFIIHVQAFFYFFKINLNIKYMALDKYVKQAQYSLCKFYQSIKMNYTFIDDDRKTNFIKWP